MGSSLPALLWCTGTLLSSRHVAEGFATPASRLAMKSPLLHQGKAECSILFSSTTEEDFNSFSLPVSSNNAESSPEATNQPSLDTDNSVKTFLISLALFVSLFLPLPPQSLHSIVYAYDPSDYASDTVQSAVQSLTNGAGNQEATFKAYENIAEIISEGKGIGGEVNYKGVSLERGFVADEDTSIYNPGLTLLTEGEKERLVEAVMTARTAGIDKNQWNDNNQFAYEFLKTKLDPLHMTELRGYLKIVPFLAGVAYLGALGVQQVARDLFPVAYISAAAIVFAPAILFVLLGQ